jgi:phage pi2 protein 07
MRICVSFLLLMLLSACSLLAPSDTAPAVPLTPQAQLPQQITRLLDKAQRAVKLERFVSPEFDNANRYYQQVLVLDAENDQALVGIENLSKILFLRAKASIAVDRVQDYRVYSSWIAQISPSSHLLVELSALDPAKENSSNSWDIASNDLKARNSRAKTKIKQAALAAREYQSRIKIIAPTDADGRWVYQQMRSFADNYLFRSSLIIGDRAKIVVLDVP